MRTYEIAALAALIILVLLVIYFVTAKGERKKVTLINSEGKRIELDAEIADSLATRARGLMGRSSLPENEGMLFVFDAPGRYGFWMFNTTIPLDAIHVAPDGTVADVISMDPCGLNVTRCPVYAPKAQAMYVLEVNQGFASKNKIMAGNSTLQFKR